MLERSVLTRRLPDDSNFQLYVFPSLLFTAIVTVNTDLASSVN